MVVMKRVLFLQNEGNNYGGVWQVNKLVGEELLKLGYDVEVVSLRNSRNPKVISNDTKIRVSIINDKDIFGTYQGREILDELKQLKIKSFIEKSYGRIKYKINLNKDKYKLQEYIKEIEPDYIVVSHYEILEMIPKRYLSRVVSQQHSSFSDFSKHRATINTIKKYNNKVRYLWLSDDTMKRVIEIGIKNNYYIYNAVRFKSKNRADVVRNKKLITIARLNKQKDLGVMIDNVKEVFKDKRFNNWVLEIYGTGEEEDYLKSKINNSRIKLMGSTDNPMEKLLEASINLNTSLFEGFSMSILEAQECGVPTVSLNYWEAVYEQIIDNETGLIASSNEDFIVKLRDLMLDSDKLNKMSIKCRENSKNYYIENLVNKWIRIFDEIDKK